MKKLYWLIVVILLTFSISACSPSDAGENDDEQVNGSQITVAVGIVPEAAFVEAVAGDIVEVVTLIPSGYSPANYQPTTEQMQALSDAQIYFTLQMPTEQANILPKVGDFNQDIEIVDLREVVSESYPLLHSSHHHDEDHGEAEDESGDHEDHSEAEADDHDDHEMEEGESVDPHVWLSPKRAIVMVQTIADELSGIDEKNQETYQANAASYIAKLETLDNEINEIITGMESKSFLIYHGAYGYFADDYGLNMVAIEIEGKQATAEELKQVISYAKQNNITSVFYQEEFDDSQAKTVAEEIDGAVEKAAPLSYDYIQGLRDFANALGQPGE